MNYFKNNNQTVFWLAGILAAIIIIFGGLFVYYGLILDNPNGEFEQSINVNSSSSDAYQIPMGITVSNGQQTQTQDPTADWLPFSVTDTINKKATTTVTTTLFSFRYPKDLRLARNTNNITLTAVSVTSTQIVINWATTTKSLKDYIKDIDKLSSKAWEGKPSIKVVTSTDQATFNNLPAVVREQKLLAADLNEYIIYFKSSSTVYSVGIIAPQLNQNLFSFLAVFVNTLKLGN